MVQQKTKKLVEVVSKRYDWKFPSFGSFKADCIRNIDREDLKAKYFSCFVRQNKIPEETRDAIDAAIEEVVNCVNGVVESAKTNNRLSSLYLTLALRKELSSNENYKKFEERGRSTKCMDSLYSSFLGRNKETQ